VFSFVTPKKRRQRFRGGSMPQKTTTKPNNFIMPGEKFYTNEEKVTGGSRAGAAKGKKNSEEASNLCQQEGGNWGRLDQKKLQRKIFQRKGDVEGGGFNLPQRAKLGRAGKRQEKAGFERDTKRLKCRESFHTRKKPGESWKGKKKGDHTSKGKFFPESKKALRSSFEKKKQSNPRVGQGGARGTFKKKRPNKWKRVWRDRFKKW